MLNSFSYADGIYTSVVLEWSKLYQVGHGHGQGQGRNKLRTVKKHLMVRPPYPPIYRDNQLPDINSISEVVVVINDVWKVGDLVDWWTDNVYWSGTITEILGEGKYRVKNICSCSSFNPNFYFILITLLLYFIFQLLTCHYRSYLLLYAMSFNCFYSLQSNSFLYHANSKFSLC